MATNPIRFRSLAQLRGGVGLLLRFAPRRILTRAWFGRSTLSRFGVDVETAGCWIAFKRKLTVDISAC
jgi:hypothetical protein